MPEQIPQNDHDLLIVLHTELKGMRAELKSMSDNTLSRLKDVEDNMVDESELKEHQENDVEAHKAFAKIDADHETRVRRLEFYLALSIGGLAALQLVLKFLVK